MTKRQDEQAIAATIHDVFREQLAVDIASTDTDLIESGVLDSLMLVDLIMHIEERFRIDVAVEDLEIENFATVDNMARYVASRSTAGSGPRHDDPDMAQHADAAPEQPGW